MSEQDSSHSESGEGATVPVVGSDPRFLMAHQALQRHIVAAANFCPNRAHSHPGIIKLLAAIQADLVGPFLDREDSTLMPVTASENKMENSKWGLHKSSTLCRRSQFPLASSHSSSERMLARARAIAQSAAP